MKKHFLSRVYIAPVAILCWGFPIFAFGQEKLNEPLPDLTADNASEQFLRCSALYSAFSGVLAEAILDMDDPLQSAQLVDLLERTNASSDGLLQAAIVLQEQQGGKNLAVLTGLSVDKRNGLSVKYLRRFLLSGSTLSLPFKDQVWAGDLAACGAISKDIVPLVKALTAP